MPLLEKAYAQINQSDWIGQDGTNSFGEPGTNAGINGGFTSNVFSQITGLAGYGANLDHSTLDQDVTAGLLISFETPKFANPTQTIDGFQIVGNHEYSVVGHNALTDEFTLFNPHGLNATDSTGLLQHVTWGAINDIFIGMDVGNNPALANPVVAVGVGSQTTLHSAPVMAATPAVAVPLACDAPAPLSLVQPSKFTPARDVAAAVFAAYAVPSPTLSPPTGAIAGLTRNAAQYDLDTASLDELWAQSLMPPELVHRFD